MDWLTDSIADLRREYCQQRGVTLACWIREQKVGGLRVLRHAPPSYRRQSVCIVYAHGGGWIVGAPETHADISAAISLATGLELFSVGYGLAPQWKAAQQCDQILTVMRNLPGRDIVLCGDSAGASLAAAAVCVAERDLRRRIRGAVLIYGFFGLLKDHLFERFSNHADGLDEACLERFLSAAGQSVSCSIFDVSKLGRLASLPVGLIAGGHDPLLGSSRALAVMLQRRRGRVRLIIDHGQRHGFLHGQRARGSRFRSVGNVFHWILTSGSTGKV